MTWNRIKQIYRDHKGKVVTFAAIVAGVVALGKDSSEVLTFVNSFNPYSEENRSLPIDIGMKISEAEMELGEPQERSFIGNSYYSHGIELNPDYEFQDKVGGVTVKRLPSGVTYKGKIDDIRLGYTIEEATEVKGSPTYWGVESQERSVAIWNDIETLTIVYFEANKNGIWVADSITYTKAASIVAYRSILLSIFQELKAGRVSIFAEELAERGSAPDFMDNELGMLTLGQFSSQYLHQKYEIVMMKPAIGGGVELYLGFNEEKVLYFWIYPLGWEQPTLRAIVDLEVLHKNFGA
ncbi:hypothetical protein AB6D20_019290 [Vibrio splendidus]|uniref:hypothetical protein n=1 Tax=Vibrio splendidus TaxID=29497 RepID=UPI0002EEE7B1|nr:hypothetical protein [Vibrio splendidus]OEF66662.1 hypothetical protein A148_24745 [Vibrio splendidus 1F-157]PMH67506.1 hypothetical protein BCU63_07290 [Vibrio splendidus]PMJ54415.1 hypothetical protein BCU23_22370 [Vibrio splendidus]PTP58761.1 hypothetical protein CWO23_23800 [Vibrio splendidus]